MASFLRIAPIITYPVGGWFAWAVSGLILLALAIRVPLLFHAWPAVDEFEHLHAAWAVAQGQIPYRDFWQIHTPLLYYLISPVLTLMGEDLRVIYVGRGLMFLCILLILLQTYRIARACFDPLTGLVAVLLLSYLLLWWRPAHEFRPDIPQTSLVLLGLWRFMRYWHVRRRNDLLFSGLILGGSFWMLAKTLFPLVGLCLVFVLSISLRRSAATTRQNLTALLLFLAAFGAPLALGGFLLWIAGALPNFLRWALINAFRYPDRFWAFSKMELDVHWVFFGLACLGMGQAIIRMVKAGVIDEFQLSPLLAGSVTAAVYLFVMPAPYPQSALPFLPIAAMYGASVMRSVVARAISPGETGPAAPGNGAAPRGRSPTNLAWTVLTALLLYGICVPPLQTVLTKAPPLQDQWPNRRRMMRYVLALTSPQDSVFDDYGVNIFRPHATYYYRLATGVLHWLRSGLIREADILSDLERNNCKVAVFAFSSDATRLPPSLLKFLLSHYVFTGFRIEEGAVFVAGQVLRRSAMAGNHATVSLVASAEYAVLPRGGAPRVYIDGRLYQAPLFLARGKYQFVVEGEFDEMVIVYSRALTAPLSSQ